MDNKYEFDAPQFVDFDAFNNTAEADMLFDMTTVGDPKFRASRKGLRDMSNTPERAVMNHFPKPMEHKPMGAAAPGTPLPRSTLQSHESSSQIRTPEKDSRPNLMTSFPQHMRSNTQLLATPEAALQGGAMQGLGSISVVLTPEKQQLPKLATDDMRSTTTQQSHACIDDQVHKYVLAAPAQSNCDEADGELQKSFAKGINNQSTVCKNKEPSKLQQRSPAARPLRPRALLQPSTDCLLGSPENDCSINAAASCNSSHADLLSRSDISSLGNTTKSVVKVQKGKRRASPNNHSSLAHQDSSHSHAKVPKLTIPVTPTFARKRPQRHVAEVKTTEQLELEGIAAMRKKLQLQRRKNAKAIGDSCKSKTEQSARSAGGAASPLKVTVPQPFNFHAGHRATSTVVASEPFRSTAELLEQFARKTPQRFHCKPRAPDQHTEALSPTRQQQSGKHPTVPKTPNLQTMKRKRVAYHVLSAEERESKEVEEMKTHQFKAHPVDRKIFERVIGVKAVEHKELTEAMDLHFATDERLRKRAAEVTAVEVAAAVSAQEDEKVSGTSAVCTRSASSASSIPKHHAGLPFLPKLKHKHTVIEPFSFEHKDKETEQRRQQLVQQVLEEERKAREFHALPLPVSPAPLPPRKAASPTQVKPFCLAVDTRGAAYQAKLKQQLEEEEKHRELEIQSLMRAKTPEVLYKKPFCPQKSQKPLTEPMDLQMELDKRVPAWEQHDAEMKQREAEIEGARRLKQQQEEAAEAAEIAKLRAQAIVRKNPIRHYKPLQILPSDKPVTEPLSPRFSERLNRKRRPDVDDSADGKAPKSKKNV